MQISIKYRQLIMSNEGNVMESLNKLIEFVEPGPQNLIVMTGKGSKLRTVFNPPLEYNMSSVGYEMCLIRLETHIRNLMHLSTLQSSIRISKK